MTPDDPKPDAPPEPAAGDTASPTATSGTPAPAEAKPPAPAAAKPPAPKPPAAPAVMQATPWEDDLTRELAGEFGAGIAEFGSYLGQLFLVAGPGAVFSIVDYLKTECGFEYLVDITAVHYPQRSEAPFDLVYILYSFNRNTRIRLKTRIGESDRPASVVSLHPTANWLEREVFDMFGIEFAGHPDLKRILMPDDWQGHPLRKDYGILQMDRQWVRENLGIDSGQ